MTPARLPIRKKLTLMELSVRPRVWEILNGTMISIDPSSGSRGSMPGYALFERGKLKDYGTVELPLGTDVNNRLHHLNTSLREQFPAPDILVVENIPPFMVGKGGFSKNIMTLIKAIGATIAAWPCPLIEVAPITWHKLAPEGYQKSDDRDAILMGYAVIAAAYRLGHGKQTSFTEVGIDIKVLTGNADKGVSEGGK